MPKILVVESNPSALSDVLRARVGATYGTAYSDAVTRLDRRADVTVIAPYDGETCPDLAEFDGVIFTGSSVDWNTDDVRAAPLAEIMEATFAAQKPCLGSCNGMQLAASVLGGASQASPNGREDGLARDIQLTELGAAHPMMRGRAPGYAVPCVHRDEVTRLPDGAHLLATNAHSEVQAFVYEQGGVQFWGVQYHPELPPAFVGAYAEAGGKITADHAADMARAESDPAAAARLGTRVQDQQFTGRTLEIRNWLGSLST